SALSRWWSCAAAPPGGWGSARPRGELTPRRRLPLRPAAADVADLDAEPGEQVAKRVRIGEAPLLAGTPAQLQDGLDERPDDLPRIARAGAGEIAELDEHGARARAGTVHRVGVEGVTRPVPEVVLEGDQRGHRGAAVARRQRHLERPALLLHTLEEGVAGPGRGQLRRRLAGARRPVDRRARRLTPGAQRVEGRGHPALEPPLTPAATQGDAAVAAHADGLGVEVEDARGVLVDAEHRRTLVEHRLEQAKPPLTHVAEAGVVGSALGVVEVGDDGAVDARLGEGVEPLQPLRRHPHLVDLVDGERVASEDAGGGAREGHAAAPAQLLEQRPWHLGASPLAERVRGAARAGEDVARLTKAGEH